MPKLSQDKHHMGMLALNYGLQAGTIEWSKEDAAYIGIAADGIKVQLGPVCVGLFEYLAKCPKPENW